MPRPRKCRMVCCLPIANEFVPIHKGQDPVETVVITVDEYETIRLIDDEGLSQEECGENMNIARTTVQQIYNNARKKIARALVNGFALKIEGGDYKLCDGNKPYCGCGGCRRQRCNSLMAEEIKEDKRMIIAIPMDENKTDVCVSFGRAPYFLFHDTNNGASEIITNPAANAPGGAGIKAAQLVVDKKASALITVRLGENSAEVLNAAKMDIYKAEGTNAKDNLTALSEGKLARLTSFHPGFHGKQ